jgi:hypothetical protein
VFKYKIGDNLLSDDDIDFKTNCSLEDAGWDVTNEDVSINDFEFPPQYRVITRDEACAMLSKPEDERKVQVRDHPIYPWRDGTLVGVYAGGYPFSVIRERTGMVDRLKYCRVQV